MDAYFRYTKSQIKISKDSSKEVSIEISDGNKKDPVDDTFNALSDSNNFDSLLENDKLKYENKYIMSDSIKLKEAVKQSKYRSETLDHRFLERMLLKNSSRVYLI